MRAQKFFVSKRSNEAIRVEVDDLPKFYPLLHFHDEAQITLIKEGKGILFAGAGFTNFSPGDLFLIGSNVPHVFKNFGSVKKVLAISIYFTQEIGGRKFWSLQEVKNLRAFTELSTYGLKIKDHLSKNGLSEMVELIKEIEISERLIPFLQLLNEMKSSSHETISGIAFTNPPPELQAKRMDNVINFISRNYNRQISLEEISSKANMTPEAFCRYFKRKTRKSFVHYLNEVRVSHSIRMMVETELAVSEIAYRTGFRNLSNFNRQFLKISGKRPMEIREMNQ